MGNEGFQIVFDVYDVYIDVDNFDIGAGMGSEHLGEFEQVVLLAILQLGPTAFALPVLQELDERAGRRVSRGALYKTLERLEAKGLRGGIPRTVYLSLSHADLYTLAAAPVVACLHQYLDGTIRRPGLWLQADAVNPERLLADVEKMGVKVVEMEL